MKKEERAAVALASLGLGTAGLPEIVVPERFLTPRDQTSPGSNSTKEGLRSEATTTSISEPGTGTTISISTPSIAGTQSFSRQDLPQFDGDDVMTAWADGQDTLPEHIWILAPGKPALEGQYDRVEDMLANGEAVWRQVDGEGWLFSCFNGRWTVAECLEEIERNAGQLRTVDPHYSRLPHECSRWMYRGEAGSWSLDAERQVLVTTARARAEQRLRKREERAVRLAAAAARRASSAPETLWVAAPPRPALQGEYRMAEGHHMNGYPVWKQVGGDGWLISSEKEFWAICSGAPRIERNGQTQLRTSATHQGKMPHEVHSWKYTDTRGVWVPDYVKSVRVLADRETAAAVMANYDCSPVQEHGGLAELCPIKSEPLPVEAEPPLAVASAISKVSVEM